MGCFIRVPLLRSGLWWHCWILTRKNPGSKSLKPSFLLRSLKHCFAFIRLSKREHWKDFLFPFTRCRVKLGFKASKRGHLDPFKSGQFKNTAAIRRKGENARGLAVSLRGFHETFSFWRLVLNPYYQRYKQNIQYHKKILCRGRPER